METKTDLRVVKTRANIRNTFIELLLEKDFNKITIQNILDNALINRSTFYKYYSDKYDLAEQLINEVVEKAAIFIDERFKNLKDDEVFSIIDKSYSYLYKEKNLIIALWGIKTDTLHLYDDLENLLKENYMRYLKTNNIYENSSLIEYYSTLYASLVLSTVKWIFTSGNEVDNKKILKHFKNPLVNEVFIIK